MVAGSTLLRNPPDGPKRVEREIPHDRSTEFVAGEPSHRIDLVSVRFGHDVVVDPGEIDNADVRRVVAIGVGDTDLRSVRCHQVNPQANAAATGSELMPSAIVWVTLSCVVSITDTVLDTLPVTHI